MTRKQQAGCTAYPRTTRGDRRTKIFKHDTYKDTSCFHTGLCADILAPNTLAIPPFPLPRLELGVCSLLDDPRVLELSVRVRPLPSLLLIASRTETAFDWVGCCEC